MPHPRLTLDRSRGYPRLLLDGQPPAMQPYLRSWEKYPGREHTTFADLCADYRRQYRLGCRVFLFYATCASDFYVPEIELWRGPGQWDFAQLDAFLDFFALECPAAVLFPQIYVGAPQWWEDLHPDELLRFHDGTCEATFSAASDSPRRKVASLASEAWVAAMDEGLARVVTHLVAACGDRLGGCLLGGGITYEWGLLGSFGMIDYSVPMRRWWDAWRVGRGLAPAALSSAEDRLAAVGDWRNPALHGVAMELQQCLSDLTAARICHFAKGIKAHGGGLVAVYYGFTLTAREGQGFIGRYGSGGFQGGHHALRTVLDCPDIDLITSPFSYADRRLETGDINPHFPWDSVRLAGKVAWLQDDNRTFMGFPAVGIDTGFEPDLANCIRQMERATDRRISGVDEMYRMDLLGGSYADPALEAAIVANDARAAGQADQRHPSAATVLVIVDETAVAALALHSPLHLQNVYYQIPHLGRIGRPYHCVLASDVLTMDVSNYRLAILALCPLATGILPRLIERLRSHGISTLSLPGTGLIGANGPDAALASRLVGVPLRCLGPDPLILRGEGDPPWGLGRALSHACVPVAGESLATLHGRSDLALALCPTNSGFAAYATVAPVPSSLLACLATRAGA